MIGAVHMPTIQIYTTRLCPYCVAAIRLLKKKGAKFNEIAVDGRPDLRAKMTKKVALLVCRKSGLAANILVAVMNFTGSNPAESWINC